LNHLALLSSGAAMGADYKVKDLKLAEQGKKQIEWAESRMPVLQHLRGKFSKTKPLKGVRVGGCLHVTKETAVLVRAIRDAGGEPVWSGCNPLSTNDEVAAALAAEGVGIYAWHGLDTKEYYWCIEQVLSRQPHLTLDDGADLIFTLHSKFPRQAKEVIGGTEETTTGVHRLRAMAKDGELLYPIIAVNDAETKWDFDNVYGTGQSTLDGILRATSILLAGKCIVVAGYGHCSRGIAMRAKGMGARVVVTEVDPIQALKAALEGMEVRTMDEAAATGDVFITATGMQDVVVERHFEQMKDGAVMCNSGHYNVEIDAVALEKQSKSRREIRPNCEEFVMKDGRRLYLLGQGRLVNLVAAEGHPSEVMDMSFANQFLSLIRLVKEKGKMKPGVYDVPREQDAEVARMKLESMGFRIDRLTKEQEKYITDYSAGT
jgi:adenosylhomocysteinase